MTILGDIIFYVIALVLLIPAVVFFAECLAAILPSRRVSSAFQVPRPRIAVIVPAHNEAAIIATCLRSVQPQLEERDRLVVIADNCGDDTAAVARRCGAMVIERREPGFHGKGYALDYGRRFLAMAPPDVVIVLDADCTVEERMVEKIASLASVSGRPVQAAYVLLPPHYPSPGALISAFAFTVKNLVRPLGMTRLGLPCFLTGTGMAFPWSVLDGVSLASSKTAEDMQLAVDLALAGHSPLFCANAGVGGCLPQEEEIARNQRTLWEHGHLDTLLRNAPRLFKAAVWRRSWPLLAMGLDLCVPPLSLLVILGTIAINAAVLWGAVTGIWGPATLIAGAGLLVFLAVIASWLSYGRAIISLSALLTAPIYVLSKIPLHLTFLFSRQNEWAARTRESKQ
jgi:cellulose synthase/poly-beta-1,6-N-acetylglucosamine synthase-like glycosyltransferase